MKPLPFNFSSYRLPPPVPASPVKTDSKGGGGNYLPIFLLMGTGICLLCIGVSIYQNTVITARLSTLTKEVDKLNQLANKDSGVVDEKPEVKV